AHTAAREAYGKDVELVRDPDVLDTWFSSALWPFSTLGWPEDTPEVKRYYQTDVLITGFDIIFFWVARMMMAGIHFMDEVPFHTVYIHALVRDEHGQKMSKSKGNVIDPLELIGTYGADALRFTLTAFAAQGRDVKLSVQRIEGYRNFCTKLWNAARFCEMNVCHPVEGFDPASVQLTLNKWIVGKVVEAERAMSGAIETYRFNDAASSIYQFTWNTFCDWYVEFTKPMFLGDDENARAETRATAAWVLDQVLLLMHPITPFITEELWTELSDKRTSSIMIAEWPELDDGLINTAANEEMDWVVRLISQVRTIRSEMNVPPGAKIPLILKDAGERAQSCLVNHADLLKRVARLSSLELLSGDIPTGSVQDVIDEAILILPISETIDLTEEKSRLDKEINKQTAEIDRFEKKLSNERFVTNAPDEVVATERQKLADAQQIKIKLQEARERLADLG
ncbi:MAG: class I tRNA ligase family protein, partial [Rhodospirillales bacterium]|nr:class I tRNA ligase family protein [Rhodospirillales bacterium]